MSAEPLTNVRGATNSPLHVRCVGVLDADLADAVLLELVAAVRDGVERAVLDLRHAQPGDAAALRRLVETLCGARERGLALDVVGRPRDWFVPLTMAGYADVLLVTASPARRGVVLVGYRAA